MLRIAFVPGVTIRKWTRIWEERRPESPLGVIPTTEAHQTSILFEREAELSFVRLPIDHVGLHVIRLYSEVSVAVLPSGHPLETWESVTVGDLASENVLDVSADAADAIELVAAGVGVAVLPHSIARLHSRKEVVACPISDAPATEIAIAWLTEPTSDAHAAVIDEFVGVVRGRTARSSRSPASRKPTERPVRGRNGDR